MFQIWHTAETFFSSRREKKKNLFQWFVCVVYVLTRRRPRRTQDSKTLEQKRKKKKKGSCGIRTYNFSASFGTFTGQIMRVSFVLSMGGRYLRLKIPAPVLKKMADGTYRRHGTFPTPSSSWCDADAEPGLSKVINRPSEAYLYPEEEYGQQVPTFMTTESTSV